ncbi:MAG: pentapeptide repeat-containing protein [Chloroherpetonaceae bacterium]|nr:pentapeptide repeat-containing protein [Chloroherpetonaceae bacterium]
MRLLTTANYIHYFMLSVKIILLPLVLLSMPLSSFAQNRANPFDGVKLVIDGKPTHVLRKVLENHQKWLKERDFKKSISIHIERSDYISQEDSLRANLTGAILSGYKGFDVSEHFFPSFAGVIFTEADLTNADFSFRDLSHVQMSKAKLEGANFSGANLDSATLNDADLRKANFLGASLKNSHLGGADMSEVNFEINSEFLPNLMSFRRAKNIEFMQYNNYPDALYQLRNNFAEIGREDISSKIGRAIEYSKTRKLLEDKNYMKALFRLVFWEWTTDYGLAQLRALLILIGLIPFFAVIYFVAILSSNQRLIYKILPADRIDGDGNRIVSPIKERGWIAFGTATKLSVFSAFAVGFREFDIGSWLYRLQGSESFLIPKGWVRSITGLQSLISLILLSSFIISILGK